MASKSARDGDSPSASAFLLPQLRHSRRGSVASLSSAHQLDKEALSQALDQIHSTASQTETLTTFNEYTSPPTSSSGPDTKGIASELQGGLTGLYNIFRASVGNVKDIVNPGPEDLAIENPPLKSSKAATHSPKPRSTNRVESIRDTSSSNSTTQATSAAGSGRQSPQVNVDTKGDHYETKQSFKPSTKSLGSTSTSAKSVTESLVALKSPPVALTQAAQLTTINPALADVNISAVKRVDANQDSVSATARNITPAEPQRLARNSRRHSYLTEPTVEASESTPSETPVSRNASQGGPKQQRDGQVSSDAKSAFGPPDRPGIAGLRAASTASVRPFPNLEDGPDEIAFGAAGSSSDPNNTHQGRPAMVVANYGNGQDDIFSIPSSNNTGGAVVDDATTAGGGYQHINIPLQKSMAPPLVTRSHSSNLSLSRISTSDTESMHDTPVPTRSQKLPAQSHEVLPIPRISPQYVASAATHRSSRTMNVFSQVKNKVLNKEYWMKDENARDCFFCGDSFSTFRRKHHCSKSYSSSFAKHSSDT